MRNGPFRKVNGYLLDIARAINDLSCKATMQVNDQTSLSWVQLHDESPTSYGILTWMGYHELIAHKTPLPYEKTNVFESVLDYFDHDTFTVCYRHSARDAPSNLATFELSGLHVAKRGRSKIRTTLRIGKELLGFFAVEDTFTKSKKSVTFDAKPDLRVLDSHDLVTANK